MAKSDEAARLRAEEQLKQKRIARIWRNFATGMGKEAYEDFLKYADDMREMYRRYAEERTMPHPNGKGDIPIDNEMVNALLQNSRGVNIMRTYILNRVNATDVAQPKTTK